ncbi:hypothetical protein PRIPAC_71797 [Pristionchus pacificus]|uniref:ceramidase n=1 Tax=Pristionchus pacificus TaxID=54126 RepID=A0A2A6CRX2_PRIPA|nr:hypothetical protein PRIPAC_71797 [Pristionchus pacificus]|eukprot:PDM80962.1 hypothetical protein PRIPAC_35965 [Pristionchus pacificus]
MLLPLLLLILPSSLLGASLHTPDNPWGEYAAECLADQPSLWDESRIETKWYKINLDAEAHDMWREIATEYSEKMVLAIDVVKNMVTSFGGDEAWDTLLGLMVNTPDMLTEPYSTEIKAMADLTQIPLNELTLLNLFYEIAKACTSLVAMDHNGKVFHGRNLDFGFLFIWNTDDHTWDLTRRLKDLVVQYEFEKEGKLLFKAVTFAGHLGILTAVRPGAYSLSSDTRFGSSLDTLTNFFLNGLDPDQQFILYANREMMTNYDNFEDAKNYIENIHFLARGYFIMGHTQGGMVVTRSYNGTDHEAVIDPKQSNGWYVLETNYDWNEPDIYLDDRTIPGNKCMQQLGRKRVTKEGIFQVMSSKTTLNKATVYTSIMEVQTGELYTFKQECKDPCWLV